MKRGWMLRAASREAELRKAVSNRSSASAQARAGYSYSSPLERRSSAHRAPPLANPRPLKLLPLRPPPLKLLPLRSSPLKLMWAEVLGKAPVASEAVGIDKGIRATEH